MSEKEHEKSTLTEQRDLEQLSAEQGAAEQKPPEQEDRSAEEAADKKRNGCGCDGGGSWGDSCDPCEPCEPCHPSCKFDPSCLEGIGECLCTIRDDVERCESILFQVGCAVFSPTFGLSEIKAEISTIETAVGGIQDQLGNPSFGLSEIKAEISDIYSAVFSTTYGLQEIKSEVSAILGQMTPESETFFKTTGPFEKDPLSVIDIAVHNNTNTTQHVTFAILENTGLAGSDSFSIDPCRLNRTTFASSGTLVTLFVEASASSGIFYYASATKPDGSTLTFEAAQWLPAATPCLL